MPKENYKVFNNINKTNNNDGKLKGNKFQEVSTIKALR